MRISLSSRYKRVKLSDKTISVRNNTLRARTKLDVDVRPPVSEGIFDLTFDATFN